MTKDWITDEVCIILCLHELCKFRTHALLAGEPVGLQTVRAARAYLRIDTPRFIKRDGELAALLIAAAFFLSGAVAGAIAGGNGVNGGSGLFESEGSIYGADTYAGLLFSCSRYHLAALLFSTSLLGVVLIPALLAVRGFALACSAAWLCSAYPGEGEALALIVLGLPGVLTVPALFVTAEWGGRFSASLLASFLKRRPPAPRPGRKENRCLAVVLMLFAAAAVEYWLVPALVRLAA